MQKIPNTAREIAATLREQILNGSIPPGTQLPAVRTLAKQYGVSRNTAAKALVLLKNEGLVTTRHGSGAYAREEFPIRVLGPDRYARSKWQVTTVEAHSADAHGGTTTQQGGQSQDVSLIEADADVAAALNIQPGELVYVRDRVMTREGVSTHTMASFYRRADVEGTALVDPRPGIAGRGGGFQVLTDRGLPPDEITEDKFARMPTVEEALLLDIPPGEPVVVVRRTTRTADGQPIEYAVGVHRASRFIWTNTFKIPD